MLQRAAWLLNKLAGKVVLMSSVYETAAWGKTDQEAFLNQVLCVETIFPPVMLMHKLLEIEKKMGRHRIEKWGPRVIDLDILYYDQLQLNHPFLQIPHPHIAARRFVLQPLAEIAPNRIHPQLHATNASLLKACTDNLEVKIYTP